MTTKTEAQKFTAGIRKLEREIAKLAQSCDSDAARKEASRLYRAADRLTDRARFAVPDAPDGCHCELLSYEIVHGRISEQRAKIGPAREQAIENACAVRRAQIAELERQARARPNDGFDGYRQELRLTFGRSNQK